MAKFKITRNGRRLILIGVLAYLLFLLISVPASFLTRYILPSVDPARQVKLQNVHGSIWNGEANDTRIGVFNLGQLNWKLNGWSLLLGDVDLRLKFKNESSRGNGKLSLGMSGASVARDVDVFFPAETLQPLFYGFPVSIAGEVRGAINELIYRPHETLNVDGRVVWQGATLRTPQNIELGNFLLAMTPHNQGTRIKITDESQGPVKTDITIRVEGDGRYALNGWLQARDPSQQHITEALRLIGRADNTGKYWVAYNGSFARRSTGRSLR